VNTLHRLHRLLHPKVDSFYLRDENLSIIEVLSQVESKYLYLCEANDYIYTLSEHSSEVWRQLQERLRQAEIAKKMRKQGDIKQREQD